jgi:coenzyme F420-dependent glucose-6-phosphate dehydrogenase
MKFKAMGMISSDPDQHLRKLKAMRELGATAIVVMNISGADPEGMIRTYGEHVLPALRDG